MNFLPLCTATVWPTNSGKIVERRDHERTTFLSFAAASAAILSSRCASVKGPFLTERPIYFLPLRLTMNLSVRLLFRVLHPRVGCTHGVTGCLPPEVLPSPPPCG